MRLQLAAVAAVLCLAAIADAACPNQCSGHGTCDATDRCVCFQTPGLKGLYRDAWTGADCSQRVCPYGISHDVISDGAQSLRTIHMKEGEPANVGFVGADAGSRHKFRVFLNGGFLVKQDLGIEFKVVSVIGSEIKFQSKWSTERFYNAEITADADQGITTSRATAEHIKKNGRDTGLYAYWDIDSADVTPATQTVFAGDLYFANVTYNQGVASLVADHNTKHPNIECSGRGACDRQRGECKCFSGYTGDACQRTTCPNDCSGHGSCQALKYFVEEGAMMDYDAIDGVQEMGCKCDSGFRGYDCAQVECPSGADPLGGNGGAEGVDCSGRGICDYSSGVCNCFKGYAGERCESQTTLL